MKKVLLVDDDQLLHALLGGQLARLDYEIIHACNGTECLEIIEQRPDIDLILMDIEMPGSISGADAALEILSFCDLPIIFHSSHNEKEIVRKIEEIASYGYIVKGTDPAVIDAIFKMALRLNAQKAKSQKDLYLLRTVFDMIDDPMTINNVSLNAMFIDCNDGFCRLTGYSRNDIIGKMAMQVSLWVSQEQQREFADLLQKHGRVDHFFHQFRKKNGESGSGFLSARMISFDGMDYVVLRMREGAAEK